MVFISRNWAAQAGHSVGVMLLGLSTHISAMFQISNTKCFFLIASTVYEGLI